MFSVWAAQKEIDAKRAENAKNQLREAQAAAAAEEEKRKAEIRASTN